MVSHVAGLQAAQLSLTSCGMARSDLKQHFKLSYDHIGQDLMENQAKCWGALRLVVSLDGTTRREVADHQMLPQTRRPHHFILRLRRRRSVIFMQFEVVASEITAQAHDIDILHQQNELVGKIQPGEEVKVEQGPPGHPQQHPRPNAQRGPLEPRKRR